MRKRLMVAAVMVVMLGVGFRTYAETLTNGTGVYLPLLALAPSPIPTPVPTAVPTAVPTTAVPTPSPFFGDCNSRPQRSDAPNYPVRIEILNKASEVVTLYNASGQPIDLTGWKLCSLNGGEQHQIPAGTIIQPGGAAIIPPSTGPVWNNTQRDDGALYDPSGRLIAYYFDAGQF